MENKKATIRDVAALANVSIATISRYLNGNIPVADETGKRIAKAIETLSYTPDRIAKSLKTGRMNNIMHVVPDITNPYYARMYRAVQGYAMQKGFTVMLYDTAALEINEEKAVQLFSNRDADGLFFCTIDKSRAVFDRLKALNRPVVTNTRFDELLFDTIYSPGGHGIYIAARHLLDLKHRDIAYAGGSAHSIVNMRRRSGFQKAMDEAGIQVHPDYFFEMDFTMDGGYRAGVYFAGLNRRPTAICCANDMIAMGVMQALNERGIRIPDDISLTGEDNIEYVQICRPGLTTTHNPSDFVAEQAVKMLIERIEEQYTGAPREVICARELIIRNSTKALPQKQ
jgi:DNA-binding LacI/PurR family transcriptional regulator